MAAVTGHYSGSIAAGNQYKDFGFSVNAVSSKAIRSDRQYNDFEGGSFDMEDHSDLVTNFVNVGMQYKKLQFRGIIDKHTVNSKDDYDQITIETYPVKFDSYIGELKQDISLSSKLVITPRVNLKIQQPWRYNGEILNDEVVLFYTQSSRYTGGINTTWNASEKLNIIGGAEYFYDKATQLGDAVFNSNGTKNLDYNNTSVFAQAGLKTKILDITAGARYNFNDRYDAAFVPRISLTKVFDRMHFKLLYSEAYRAPNTQNIDLNPDIEPEHTTVIEFQAGVKVLPSIYVTGNLYDITTKDPILYFYENITDKDGYRNATQTGTKGAEFDVQWKFNKGYVNLTYGYYTAEGKNEVEEYSVPANDKALLAVPNHKLTLASNFRFGSKYNVNPSVCYMGARYGLNGSNDLDEPVISKFNPVCLVNLTFRAEEILVKGLSAGISMFNILDQKDDYLQPYTGGHAELPGRSRELTVNITYAFSIKQK
jgi:hypothetical protein